MSEPNMTITFEIEPIVKLYCKAIICKHNLMNSRPGYGRQPTCGLKHISISHDGKCIKYEPEEEKKQ